MGDIIVWNGKKYECKDNRVSNVHYGIGGKLMSDEKYCFMKLQFKNGETKHFKSSIENHTDVNRASNDAKSKAEEYLKSL